MHTTLTVRTNGALACLWATVVATSFAVGTPPMLQFLLSFLLLGLAIGAFQSLAMRSSPAAFLDAESSSAVKKALLSSTLGKLSIAAMWSSVGAILWLVWFKSEWASLQTLFGSYAVLLLGRELASFPGVLLLSRIRNVQ